MKAVCRHVAEGCPGCSLIHRPYEEQLHFKMQSVRRTLQSHFHLSTIQVKPCVASPEQFHYRSSAKYSIEHEAHGPALKLGIMKSMSQEVVDIPDCKVSHKLINVTANEIRKGIRLGDAKSIDFVTNGEQVVVNVDDGALRVLRMDDHHYVHVGGFVQANPSIARLIAQYISNHPLVKGSILELYSGSGAMTFSLAQRHGRVVSVESSKTACSLAQKAADERGFGEENLRIVCGDAAAVLASGEVGSLDKDFHCVVVNPPRCGLDLKVREALIGSSSLGSLQTVVYVSCNPLTLARDLAHFARMGWKTVEVVPFDMMPQTERVEVVAVLQRGPGADSLLLNTAWPDVMVYERFAHQQIVNGHTLSAPGPSSSGVTVMSMEPVSLVGNEDPSKSHTYTCLVRGQVKPKARLRWKSKESRYDTIEVAAGQHHSLIRVTGQLKERRLRAVLRAINHPVVGDSVDQDTATHFRLRHGLDRPFVHRNRVELSDGRVFESLFSLPADLEHVLHSLKWKYDREFKKTQLLI